MMHSATRKQQSPRVTVLLLKMAAQRSIMSRVAGSIRRHTIYGINNCHSPGNQTSGGHPLSLNHETEVQWQQFLPDPLPLLTLRSPAWTERQDAHPNLPPGSNQAFEWQRVSNAPFET